MDRQGVDSMCQEVDEPVVLLKYRSSRRVDRTIVAVQLCAAFETM